MNTGRRARRGGEAREKRRCAPSARLAVKAFISLVDASSKCTNHKRSPKYKIKSREEKAANGIKSHIQQPILLRRFVSLPNRKVRFMRRGVTQSPMGGRRRNGRANERETLSDSCPIETLSASTACSLSTSAV